MAANNVVLCYPNRASAAAFSGGAWLADLPAANLANRELWRVARSVDALVASTKFQVSLDGVRRVRAVALCNHNLSATATWRVSVGTTPEASNIYAGGWESVWEMAADNLPEWGDVNWWGMPGSDEYLRHHFAAICDLGDLFNAQHISVEISDPANADGYVQIGRFFAGGGLQPTYNRSYGLQDGWRDLSTIDSAESGAIWPTARRRLRYSTFVLERINHAEAADLHEMQRLLGTVEEVLYIPYPGDMGASQRYGFLGRLSELSAIDYPYPAIRSLPLKIEELG